MSILNRLYRAFERTSINLGRSNARQHLLRCDDRVLADGGFSRELLELGNDAWPWRVETSADSSSPWAALAAEGFRSPIPVATHEATAAVAELRQMSDADLDDLGIARSNIVEAVRDGRPGIDREAA